MTTMKEKEPDIPESAGDCCDAFTRNREQISALYKKMNALRADVLTKDWADDKMYSAGNTQYPYLSADKVKKTMAPLFHKHGLELRMEFSGLEPRSPIGNMSQHWTVCLEVFIIDIDTGYMESTVVYGEAGDVGDKGISKAQTSAIKQWVFAEFLIADGVDPDGEGNAQINRGTFTKKSAEEVEEVKSKVLSNGVIAPKPKAPGAPKAPVAPKVTERSADATETPVPATEAPVKASAHAEVTEKPAEDPAKYEPTEPQRNALNHILSAWSQKLAAGTVSNVKYKEISDAYEAISSSKDVTDFIRNFKVV